MSDWYQVEFDYEDYHVCASVQSTPGGRITPGAVHVELDEITPELCYPANGSDNNIEELMKQEALEVYQREDRRNAIGH